MKNLLRILASGAMLFVWCGAANAEANQVRFARQLGLGYLQFYVMQDKQMLEKQAERARARRQSAALQGGARCHSRGERLHCEKSARVGGDIRQDREQQVAGPVHREDDQRSGISYAPEPENVMKIYSFMNKVGALKNMPAAWQELFFPEAHGLKGN